MSTNSQNIDQVTQDLSAVIQSDNAALRGMLTNFQQLVSTAGNLNSNLESGSSTMQSQDQLINNLKSTLGNINKKCKDMTSELNNSSQSVGNLSSGIQNSAQNFSSLSDKFQSLKELNKLLKSASKSCNTLNSNSQGSSDGLDSLRASIQRTNSQIKDLKKAMNKVRMKNLSNGVNNLAAGLTPLSNEIKSIGNKSIRSALVFDKSMAKLSLVANTTQVPIGKLRKQILSLSDNTGVSATTLSKYADKVITAGVSTKNAMKVVTAGAKLAKVEYSGVGSSIDTLMKIMKLYDVKTKNTNKVTSDLITVQKQTKMSFKSLSSEIEKISPSTKKLGLNFNNVCASLGIISKNGKVTSKSVKGLNGLFVNLSNSGSKSNQILERLSGGSFKELIKKGGSVGGVLSSLKTECDRNHISFSKLFGSISAGNVAMALAKNHGSKFNKELKKMKNNSNVVNKAFKAVSNTAGNKFTDAINGLKNAGIKLGGAIMPLLSSGVGLIKSLTGVFNDLGPTQMKVIAGVGLLIVGFVSLVSGMNKVITSVKLVAAAIEIMGGPITITIAAIAAFIAIIVEAYKHIAAFRRMVNDVASGIANVGRHIAGFMHSIDLFSVPKKIKIKSYHDKYVKEHYIPSRFKANEYLAIRSQKINSFASLNRESLNTIRNGIGSLGMVEAVGSKANEAEMIANKIADKIINAISKSNDKYIQTNVILDGRQIATATAQPINEINGKTFNLSNRQRGIL